MEVIVVQDESDVAEARRVGRKAAQESGLNSSDVEKAAIIMTEAASNVLKHAQRGKILVHSIQGVLGFVILDKGPGITNLSIAMQDGFSTAGSKGTGLGAMSRLSTEFEVYSQPNSGTAIWVRLSPQIATIPVWTVETPKNGEVMSGDALVCSPQCDYFMAVDGLGHGPEAHAAAQEAVQVFKAHMDEVPLVLLNRLHLALRKTRGAAAAVAQVNREKRQIRFAGVGNIHAVLHSPGKSQSMVSMNGTLGSQIRQFQEFTYQWEGDHPLLIMHSDGLMARWSLEDYPGLAWKPLPLIAGVLFRDFNREYDDVSLLAARLQ